ncbi:Endonuclease V [Streptoalloteichus tenebrarius]|uniref:Endonuclease V n=1 Tax=Streptoalloteichus tenebrarius (strain ATCC 17920 / DSM 40477 / JCM 4838 / CBS 697.72 / NBRC 16177 / NCIMB 11028 / NRRL B-12390 / A12253. 1 / ISP 5477) TaxID=1933 RepID=A0ABT1HVA7_STRSD|nr:deoxyribonuclease V [Streptoalloteichus tenebrarius]MCP2259402.1 Endonuclease V [Streptoalloteichus tenebrarius]BFF02344.1 endonuclease V [Streptoalloteichus tenebrarius]
MRVRVTHDWPCSAAEAEALQERLRSRVRASGELTGVRTVAGLDVAYADGSDDLVAAVAVLDAETLSPVDSAVVPGTATFPYVPGLFAFRELPALVDALERLATTPDLLVVDGQGIAHPRRFGLACHLGVLTGVPSIGVAKTPLGRYEPPGPRRGDWTPLLDGDEVVGRALRTQDGVRPVFVSVGHLVDLDTATEQVLRLAPRYRLPETTRQADHLGRAALAR